MRAINLAEQKQAAQMEPVSAECSARQMLNGRTERADCERKMFFFFLRWPCTPYGCMKMLESIGYSLKGKHAVVIGRSNIVGKPMALMLLQQNATVTICHSGTVNLKEITLQADVIVAAVGKRNVLTADMVKLGAVVLDVGMNRNDEGKLCGDVDFEGVKEVAGYITPVPGGVGPMTITMLLVNTLESAQNTLNKT